VDHLGRDLSDVLVTGAAGYLGGKVLAQLVASGVDAIGCARRGDPPLECCDLLDADATRALIERFEPRIVVHCASTITLGGDPAKQAGDAAANVAMVGNLLAAGVAQFVFTSSMTVYAPSLPMPVREETTAPESEYGRSKLECERLLLAASGVVAVNLRLPGLFGPPRRGGIVYGLLRALQRGETPVLPPAPLMWATLHVDDAAEIIARVVADFPRESQTLNVGYARAFGIDALAWEAAHRCGREIGYAVAHPRFEMELTKLKRSYGLPRASFEERLSQMMAFAQDHPPA
jgi:nucleoside-diphosphate-sugar epimerase